MRRITVTAEAPAPVERLVTLRLTRDELTSLMHALEVAKNEAYQALIFVERPRNPAYPQARPEMQQAQRNAAGETYLHVTELCDMVTDIWRESR